MNFKKISVEETKSLIKGGDVTIVDIRDPQSYSSGHIDDALHLGDDNVEQFLAECNKLLPLIVYCFHGHSSQSAAAYFAANGFADVYSMDGGYAAWS